MTSYLDKGYGVILNVNNGGHWVLATGHSSSGFTVNDPGFSKTSYGNGDVKEAAIYKPISRLAEEGEEGFEYTYPLDIQSEVDEMHEIFEEVSQ